MFHKKKLNIFKKKTNKKQSTKEFFCKFMKKKLPKDWTIIKKHKIDFNGEVLYVDFLVKTENNDEIIILIDSFWKHLNKTKQQLKQSKNKKDIIVLNKFLKNRRFNYWATKENKNVLRFENSEIKSFMRNKKEKINCFFSCGNFEVYSMFLCKLNE